LGSAGDAQIAPGLLGAVSTSNIIAGGRTHIARLATMLVGRGEDSRKKDSILTAEPTATPTVAAAAGTAIYQNLYWETVAPADALKKVGEYCVKTTRANRGEEMTAAPTPMVAAASGTAMYEDSYGDTVLPAEVQKKRGKRVKTARANQGEDSRKKDSSKTAASTPLVAAAPDTAIEVDYLPEGHIIISSASKEADDAVAISEYFMASADYEPSGSGRSGPTRKPPANKL
jgi:hypothetical protein